MSTSTAAVTVVKGASLSAHSVSGASESIETACLMSSVACGTANSHSYFGATMTDAASYHQRDGAALEYFDGKYWLLGGWWPDPPAPWNPDVLTNEVWSSPDLVTWTQHLTHASSPPTSGPGARWKGRHTFGHWQSGGYIYVSWGDTSPELDIWRSNDPGNVDGWERWAATPADPLTVPPFNLAGWVVWRNALWVFGGYRAATTTATAEVWRSTDNGQTWTRMADMPFVRGSFLKPVILCDKVYIIGGSTDNGNPRTWVNDTWRFDGTTWAQKSTTAGWKARDWIANAAYDDKLWTLTGSAPEDTGGCWYSEDYGVTWVELTNQPWGISHADAVAVNDAIVIASGHGQGKNVYRYRADIDRSTPNYHPTDETGAIVWLDSSQVVHASGKVSQVTDQSGNARHATQATAANQPLYVASDPAFGGHPCIAHDGANDYLDVAAFTTEAQPFTLYGAVRPSAIGSLFFLDDTDGTSRVALFDNAAGGLSIYGGTAIVSGGTQWTAGAVVVFCVVFDGVSTSIYLNNPGTPVNTGDSGANGLKSMRIGSRFSLESFFAGKWAALGGFAGAHDILTRDRVMNHLNAAYRL